MLQRLERADQLAELHAGLHVVDRGVERLLREADLLGGHRRRSAVEHLVEQSPAAIGLADHRLGTDLHIREGEVA